MRPSIVITHVLKLMFRILTTADILESLDRDWQYATSFASFPAYFEIRLAVPTGLEGLVAGRPTRPVRTDSRFHIFGWVQAGLNCLRRSSTHARYSRCRADEKFPKRQYIRRQ